MTTKGDGDQNILADAALTPYARGMSTRYQSHAAPATAPCIAIDCRMLGMSGIGVYLENLVPAVMRQLPACCFRLIGHEDKIRALPLPHEVDMTIHPCSTPIYSVQEQWNLPLAAKGAHLLWVPHYNIPLFTTTPLMVTVHDVAHLVLPEVTRSRLRHSYARLLFEGVRRKAKSILCVSQFTADEFVRHVGKPKGSLRVVHNGVDAAWFDASAEQGQVENAEVPYFIAVGNLKAHKRMDVLCRAFAAVKEHIPHNLVLVGKNDGFISGGQSVSDLLALAPQRITCTGPISAERLRALVHGAAALVFPSSYEGFGLPPLEAMAAGVPVIAADIPPVREVCGEWVRYFAVDDVNALENTLKEAGKEHGHCAKNYSPAHLQAANFTWSKAAAAVTETMRHLALPPAGF